MTESEEIRWVIIKTMLDEFPELRLKCLEYIRETEKRQLKALMKKYLPEKVFKRVLILYNEKDCQWPKNANKKLIGKI